MKRIILGASAVLLLTAWTIGVALAAPATNACLSCHTNGEILKSLYKPPAMEGGEAEGRLGVLKREYPGIPLEIV